MHDVVALLQDVRTKHLESGRALLLRRGQIGTIVMSYPDGAYEVEFADRDGGAFAIFSPARPIDVSPRQSRFRGGIGGNLKVIPGSNFRV